MAVVLETCWYLWFGIAVPHRIEHLPDEYTRLRQARGLSLRQLSQALKVLGTDASATHLGWIERGVRNPSPSLRVRLAQFYGVPPQSLYREVPVEEGDAA